MTNAQTLKAKIIDLLTFYITEKENDITTGKRKYTPRNCRRQETN